MNEDLVVFSRKWWRVDIHLDFGTRYKYKTLDWTINCCRPCLTAKQITWICIIFGPRRASAHSLIIVPIIISSLFHHYFVTGVFINLWVCPTRVWRSIREAVLGTSPSAETVNLTGRYLDRRYFVLFFWFSFLILIFIFWKLKFVE